MDEELKELKAKIEAEWTRVAPNVRAQTPLMFESLLNQVQEAIRRYAENRDEVILNGTKYLLEQELLLLQINSYKA